MRQVALFLSLALFFVSGCVKSSRWEVQVPQSQIVSYQIQDNHYVIFVVEDNDVTVAQAKETARQKAAQITLDNGYRYFSIVSESKIKVVKSGLGQMSQMPGNLYQEYIIEKQFGRDSLERNPSAPPETYPALRLEIECYSEKPFIKNSIDAQAYLNQ